MRFYTEKSLKLRVLDYVPSYKELFGDDEELDGELEAASESKHADESKEEEEESDSPLPDLAATSTVTSKTDEICGDHCGTAIAKAAEHPK